MTLACRASISIPRPRPANREFSSCKGNCLKCFDESETCSSCPINFFTFQEEIVTEKKESNFLNSILGIFMGFMPIGPKVKVSEIKIVTKCLKECPKKHNGHDVSINLAERKCL